MPKRITWKLYTIFETSPANSSYVLQVTLLKERHGVRSMAKTVIRKMKLETATFGAGCFWCVEAVFLEVEGVHTVVSGYTGGTTVNPTYEAVCMGMTGHTEVAQIQFDPNAISYEELLEVFWHTHDATTLNRQGADVGTQYRSAIYYHTEDQRQDAENSKAEMDASDMWDAPIVTEITPIDVFYPAEDYHQNYFQMNPNQPYCQFVIHPKMQKFTKDFKDKLKK